MSALSLSLPPIDVHAPWRDPNALEKQVNVYHNGSNITLFKGWDVYRSR